MSNVMIFTIRPVQTFIGESRKFIDLVNGSRMLSEIIGEGMKFVDQHYSGIDFIYPNFQGNSSLSYPNVFICKFQSGEDVGNNVMVHLQSWLEKKLDRLNFPNSSELTSKVNEIFPKIKQQMLGLLNYDWVILPLDGNEFDTYNELKKLFAAVKRVNRFNLTQDKGLIKCTSCGHREAVLSFDRKKTGIPEIKKFTPNEGQRGELLCGVCLTKRFWFNKQSQVFSVAQLANQHLIEHLKDDKDFLQLKSELGSNFDMQAIFPENFANKDVVKRRFNLEVTSPKIQRWEEISRRIESKIKDLEKGPSKYYAILVFDGDDMGKIVGGEYLENKSMVFEEQKKITKTLDKFTLSVRNTIYDCPNDYVGELVYAGGDDVLAVFNFHQALSAAKRIRESYPSNMGGKENPTASAGLVFVHYRTNLGRALNLARAAEKKSKSFSGKDAVTIAFFPRGGSFAEATFKWKYDDIDMIEFIEGVVSLIKSKELSSTFIYKLKEEFTMLENKELSPKDRGMIRLETKRLVERAYNEEKKEKSKVSEKVSFEVTKITEKIGWSQMIEILNFIDSIARRAK